MLASHNVLLMHLIPQTYCTPVSCGIYIHCVHSLWCTRNKYKLSVAMLHCFKMILYKSTHDYPYIILYLECSHVQYLLQVLCPQTAAHCRHSARLHALVSTYVHTMCMSQPQLSTHPSHNSMLTYVSATVESHPHHHPPPPPLSLSLTHTPITHTHSLSHTHTYSLSHTHT